jgi:hypothetical protein
MKLHLLDSTRAISPIAEDLDPSSAHEPCNLIGNDELTSFPLPNLHTLAHNHISLVYPVSTNISQLQNFAFDVGLLVRNDLGAKHVLELELKIALIALYAI